MTAFIRVTYKYAVRYATVYNIGLALAVMWRLLCVGLYTGADGTSRRSHCWRYDVNACIHALHRRCNFLVSR